MQSELSTASVASRTGHCKGGTDSLASESSPLAISIIVHCRLESRRHSRRLSLIILGDLPVAEKSLVLADGPEEAGRPVAKNQGPASTLRFRVSPHPLPCDAPQGNCRPSIEAAPSVHRLTHRPFLSEAVWKTPFTCADDELSKKLEPNAPPTSERLDWAVHLAEMGYMVILAFNPLVEKWMPKKALETIGACPIKLQNMLK